MSERITINLTISAQESLYRCQIANEESKTDIMNRAVILYELVRKAQNNGGSVYIREFADSELTKLHIL